MKLIVYDAQWAGYAARFASGLGAAWQVEAGANDDAWLKAKMDGADALVALKLPESARETARGLRMFLFPGAGVMDPAPAHYPAGCAVVNVYEHGVAIAEFAMTAILMHATEINRYAATFRQGLWDGSGRTGGATHGEVAGKTVGLIGHGGIGRAVEQRALAFGMNVIAIDDQSAARLPELLAASDYIVVCCPLDASTQGMLGAAQLAMLKPNAYLVNVARAEVIDEQALYEVLREGRIAGAALDVWYQYPSSGAARLHGSALPFHELPNVVATPHMAGWTSAMVERRIARMVENLRHLERGETLERVVFTGEWR